MAAGFSVQPLCSLCSVVVVSRIPITTEQQRTQRMHREEPSEALKVELLNFEPVIENGGGVGEVTRPLAGESEAEKVYVRPRRDLFENGLVMA